MDIQSSLKKSYEKTLEIAFRLEEVNAHIYQRNISPQGKKWILKISKEINHLNKSSKQPLETHDKPQESPSRSFKKSESVKEAKNDLGKKCLSSSLKEVNQRVKMSKAGKRIIGNYIKQETSNLPIISKLKKTKQEFTSRSVSQSNEKKPLPYVSLTTGKVEQTNKLPTYEEFLRANDADYLVKKDVGKVIYQIDRATKRLDKLKIKLQNMSTSAIRSPKKQTASRVYERPKSKVFKTQLSSSVKPSVTEKTAELKKTIEKYYPVEEVIPPQSQVESNQENSLENSYLSFYKSKEQESKKLSTILEKLGKERPLNLRNKLKLINQDKGSFKNRDCSLLKFNNFRQTLEQKNRNRQYYNHKQAVVYLQTLDEMRITKHSPIEEELLVLELWKQMLEEGWVISPREFRYIVETLSVQEQNLPNVKLLLDKLQLHVVEFQ